MLAGQLRGAVSLAQQLLSNEIAAAIADAQQAGDTVRSRAVKAAARDDPQLAQSLPQLGETAAARIEAAQELERYQKQAFAQMENDLEELVATFGSAPPASSS
jgi:exosome complex RNA-binding protein Csl4